jgi:hypothetical protein
MSCFDVEDDLLQALDGSWLQITCYSVYIYVHQAQNHIFMASSATW